MYFVSDPNGKKTFVEKGSVGPEGSGREHFGVLSCISGVFDSFRAFPVVLEGF